MSVRSRAWPIRTGRHRPAWNALPSSKVCHIGAENKIFKTSVSWSYCSLWTRWAFWCIKAVQSYNPSFASQTFWLYILKYSGEIFTSYLWTFLTTTGGSGCQQPELKLGTASHRRIESKSQVLWGIKAHKRTDTCSTVHCSMASSTGAFPGGWSGEGYGESVCGPDDFGSMKAIPVNEVKYIALHCTQSVCL